MLKKTITYTDFNGNECTDTCYFNLSKKELIELGADFQEQIDNIVKRQDTKEVAQMVCKIIALAYGEKSEDGKRFKKNGDISAAFIETAAFDAMYDEMLTKPEAFNNFVMGITPNDLQQ